ncbi:MAG: hypothetical protein ACXVLF_00695 [Flavisolibacter sp.]
MKKSTGFMAAAFLLAVGSAFTTRPFISPVGTDPGSTPPNQCVAGTINQPNCLKQPGTPCTVTFPDGLVANAYDVTCADGNQLRHP